MPAARPRSLADFLRACRERLRPADLGLPAGRRRRTPGLRREEVATLCGISPAWYTWLEQGRTAGVSVETLVALAEGLRLSRAEREYLFALAARADPAAPRAAPAAHPDLQPLVRAVRTPAYLLDRHWDAAAWNRPAAELFGAWLGAKGRERNLLRYVFLAPAARRFIVGWGDRAQRLVAEYRADTAAWQDDPVRQALVNGLAQESADFAAAWRAQRVLAREGGQRRFEHPRRGRCAYVQHTLRVAQQPDLKLIVLVPEGAA
jgi:transcriptional regulator with XRE-family HTH domain